MIFQAQRDRVAAKCRAGQDGQIEDLQFGERPNAIEILETAAHRIARVARQSKDQIDADTLLSFYQDNIYVNNFEKKILELSKLAYPFNEFLNEVVLKMKKEND